jgi:DNA (cytosine-5)-methyltransferase 1
MLQGLDLFSGTGGITKALEGYVIPIAYCEIDGYAKGVLLSRQSRGEIPYAPIWDDIQTLKGTDLPPVDIVYGGFPCQDISTAGRGAGLAGERSGLFFEIMRLAEEVKPKFISLENVPAIRTRGLGTVVEALAALRYDCRWGMLSARDVGANHKRERWFLLAYLSGKRRFQSNSLLERSQKNLPVNKKISGYKPFNCRKDVPNTDSTGFGIAVSSKPPQVGGTGAPEGPHSAMANPSNEPASQEDKTIGSVREGRQSWYNDGRCDGQALSRDNWWVSEPNVGRVAHGIPKRVDRLRALGNAVVPQQAREAFERLMGLK